MRATCRDAAGTGGTGQPARTRATASGISFGKSEHYCMIEWYDDPEL